MMQLLSLRRAVATAALMAAIAFMLFARGAYALVLLDPVSDPILLPPTDGGKPVAVKVGIDIINIPDIDEVKEQFELDGYLFAQWIDPRLTFKSDTATKVEKLYKPGEIWMPSLEFVNASKERDSYDKTLSVSPEGVVHYAERFHAVLSSRFELRRFPFDRQALEVHIQPLLRNAGVETLEVDHTTTGMSAREESYTSLAQWNLKELKASATRFKTYRGFMMSDAVFALSASRRSAFYVWKVFLPLLLMVILSWTVFWVDAADLSNQVQIAVTTILTVIAFAFAISATMPRVSYLTYIDGFFLTCYVFVFLAIIELMIVHITYRRIGAKLSHRIRRNSRWLVPLAFVAANAFLIADFLG